MAYKWNDNEVLLGTLTRACKRTNDIFNVRLPIGISLLEMILFELERLFSKQWYCEVLYKAIFLLGYYGMLRVGEMAKGDHTIKAKDVYIGDNKDKILLILYSSKTHGQESIPQEIKISALQNKEKIFAKRRNFCPFAAADRYRKLRGGFIQSDDQFFVFSDGSLVLPCHIRNVLHTLLKRMNLNPMLYNTHSLRTGRSCDLLKFGYTVGEIKRMGRWKSNAVYKYLKYYFS